MSILSLAFMKIFHDRPERCWYHPSVVCYTFCWECCSRPFALSYNRAHCDCNCYILYL